MPTISIRIHNTTQVFKSKAKLVLSDFSRRAIITSFIITIPAQDDADQPFRGAEIKTSIVTQSKF